MLCNLMLQQLFHLNCAYGVAAAVSQWEESGFPVLHGNAESYADAGIV